MTVDELIIKLEKVRLDHGKDVRVYTTEYGEAYGRGMPDVLEKEVNRVFVSRSGEKKVFL